MSTSPYALVTQPGVIPLRPLTLGDIFNGSYSYIRANPKATLGLTAVVVVIAQVLALILQVGPLAATGKLEALRGDDTSTSALLESMGSGLPATVTTAVSAILLSGMLTVIVGRSVFGGRVSIGEAWAKLRGRLAALIGLTALEALGAAALIGAVALLLVGVTIAVNGAAAIAIGIPLVLAVIGLLIYLGTMLSFAAPLIVLERLAVFPAIRRSFALVRGGFWRVLGIRALAALVAGAVGSSLTVPFTITGQALFATDEASSTTLIAVVLIAIGNAIAQIITAPFSAGVVVLLYADRRMRSEAFDLVLQSTPATHGSTDNLWMIRPY